MLKQSIAASLEVAFSQYGFAEPSVARLKDACNVSLRTLYKHYPSKEMMVIGALEYRHQRYLSFLLESAPPVGVGSVLHLFERLELWMIEFAPNGCLSLNALSAYPDNEEITQAVIRHKREVQQIMAEQSGSNKFAGELFLLHEGVSGAWPIIGHDAVISAKKTIQVLMEQ